MSVKNALYIKQFNRTQLLRLLRQKPISRAEMARQTGLTRAAISMITEELIKEGLVKESSQCPQSHARGRSPVLLKLCADGAYAIGIWLGRHGCQLGLCDFRGQPVAQRELVLSEDSCAGVQQIAHAVEQLLEQTAIPRDRILGAGICAPGPVDTAAGKILIPPNYPYFHNYPIADALSQQLQLPVYLEKDANAAALYNYMDGSFNGRENFILLSVGRGVGSGVIWQGRLLRTCELGHTCIDYQGPRCACGNTGCLELYASTDQIRSRYPGYENWEALISSPHKADILTMEAEYLSAAIINLTNLLPMDAVLLAGQLHSCWEQLAPLIAARLKGRSLVIGEKIPEILPALQSEAFQIREACSIVFGHYLKICPGA